MSVYGHLAFKNDIRYVVNEAYVGKTETLLEMEKCIGEIRENALKRFTDIDKSKEVQKLNRLFEKQFGMEVFALHIEQSNIINAYTIPINRRFDIAMGMNISKYVEGNVKTGYRFKPHNGLCIICTVYLGLLKMKELTNGELLAIILHELGHNFADAIYNKINYANKSWAKYYYSYLLLWTLVRASLTLGLSLIIDVPLMFAPAGLVANNNYYIKPKEEKQSKNPLRGVARGLTGAISDFSYFTSSVFSRIFGGAGTKFLKNFIDIEANKKEIKAHDLGRQNEVIADKFAGIYGYGPEAASALLKMSSNTSTAEKFVRGIPIIGKMQNSKYEDAVRDMHNFDVHPQVIQRANSEISLLEDELKKSSLDPKLEKVIKEQIKELKKIVKDATTVTDEAQRDERARIIYNKFINNEDPDAVTAKVEDEIHKAFDKALKEAK